MVIFPQTTATESTQKRPMHINKRQNSAEKEKKDE
jgi:hypothetical protein